MAPKDFWEQAGWAGYSTGEVSREYGLSPGRISQLLRELRASWQGFHGERPAGAQQGDGRCVRPGVPCVYCLGFLSPGY